MVALHGDMQEGSYSVKCQSCGAEVALLAKDELLPFIVWLTERNEAVFCFDCDPALADEVPPGLQLDRNGRGIFQIDGRFIGFDVHQELGGKHVVIEFYRNQQEALLAAMLV